MGSPILLLVSHFSRLKTMGSVMEQQIKAAILISSLSKTNG